MKKVLFSAASLVFLSFVATEDKFICKTHEDCRKNSKGM